MSYKKSCNKMPDLSGHKFGRWLVLHKDLDRLDHKGIKSYYICQCDCGSIHSVSAYGLRNGTSKSCGCKTKDRITKYNYRHGLSRTDIYRIFRCMKERCYSPKHSSYKNYGGRGIGICEEWKNNPESFVNWALNSDYQKGLTIDRKDVNGNYSPENCKWATRKEQVRNRTNTVYIHIDGNRYSLSEFCEKHNLSYGAAWQNFRRNNRNEELLIKYLLRKCNSV